MKKSLRKTIRNISVALLIISFIVNIIIFDYNNPTSIVCLSMNALGVIGSILSIFIPNKYKCDFTIDDWKPELGNSYSISITSKKHGLGKEPQVSVFSKNKNGTFEEVITALEINSKGDITIGANIKFDGRITVK
jgi:hypothetical protein